MKTRAHWGKTLALATPRREMLMAHALGRAFKGMVVAGCATTVTMATAQTIDRTEIVLGDNGVFEAAVGFCFDTIYNETSPDVAAQRVGFERSTDTMLSRRFESRRAEDPSFGHYRSFWVDRDIPDMAQATMVPVDPSIDVNTNSISCEITIMGLDADDEARLLPTALAYFEAYEPTLVLRNNGFSETFSPIDISQYSAAASAWHGGLYFENSDFSGGVSYVGDGPGKPTGTFEIELTSSVRLNERYGN